MILQLLFAILGFLVSTWGIMSLLIGVVLFIALPMLSTISRFKQPANAFLKLAAFPLNRAAVLVSEHNDALFKRMQFDGLGVERMTVDGEEKVFEDPDNALHHFLGIPFALAWEKDGVLFDPRHAAAGQRKRDYDARNESTFLATEYEWEEYGVSKWMPGVFAMPKKHELVDLSAVVELVDGGERSEYAKRVEEFYQHSQDPFGDGTPAIKYLYPIIAIAITFGGTWFMASQFGLPSARGTGSVSFGVLWLLFGPTLDMQAVKEWLAVLKDKATSAGGTVKAKLVSGGGSGKDGLKTFIETTDWKLVAGVMLMIGVPVGTVAGLYIFLGLITTISILTAVLLGFLLLPVLTFLAQPVGPIAGTFSKLYFKLGFFGYRQPVVCWTPKKYVVKEKDQLRTTEDIQYYDLFGHTIGFTYEADPSSWGPEVLDTQMVDAQTPVTDGGTAGARDTNLPAKYARAEEMGRDTYGAFVPTRLRHDEYYLDSGIVMERFNNSADGEKSMKKLLEAKEIHGGGNQGIDDSTVFKASIVTGLLGLILGIAIFIVPAFL
jgi:hypothetical protein